MEKETTKVGSWMGLVKIFLVLIFLPVVAIWYVWKKTTWSKRNKWIATIAILFVLLLVIDSNKAANEKSKETAELDARVAALENKLEQEKQKSATENVENFKPVAEVANKEAAATELHEVISVTDGDTLKINLNGNIETLRLIGIDTPETVDPRKPVQCFGQESSDKAKQLLSGKKVSLEADPTQGERDQYGRLLRYVFLED